MPSALKAQSLNHWMAREVPGINFLGRNFPKGRVRQKEASMKPIPPRNNMLSPGDRGGWESKLGETGGKVTLHGDGDVSHLTAAETHHPRTSMCQHQWSRSTQQERRRCPVVGSRSTRSVGWYIEGKQRHPCPVDTSVCNSDNMSIGTRNVENDLQRA